MEVGKEGEEDSLKGFQGCCGFLRLNKLVLVVLRYPWAVGPKSPTDTKICECSSYLYEMAQNNVYSWPSLSTGFASMDAPRNFNPWLVESADGDPAEMED